MEMAAQEFFYDIRLPRIRSHPSLPSNNGSARKRLGVTIMKLRNNELLSAYDAVCKDWLSEGIIEVVSEELENCHFLPHRPIVK